MTTADLAARRDFTLGLAIVSPSTRTIAGPGGTTDVEPRVMQVLVVLADCAGQVVTRETLFRRCWGGVFVGDDSLNRAVGAVRKLAAEIAGGSFEIETVPRTGYRVTGAILEPIPPNAVSEGSQAGRLSRRELGTVAAGTLLLGGIGAWSAFNSLKDRQFAALMRKGAEGILDANKLDPVGALRALEMAVRLQPENAAAWGLLAFGRSIVAQSAQPRDAAAAVEAANEAARTALRLDGKQPYGLLAMFELQGSMLDWSEREQRLRQIIAIDPTNIGAISELVLLLQATGLNRESWNWNERAIELQPLSIDFLSKRAMKHWIFGRIAEADKVIDQLRALYPTNPWPWFVRLMLFAHTGRPVAAQAMLDSDPQMLTAGAETHFWRTAVHAIAVRSPAAIADAKQTCLASARLSGRLAAQAVLALCTLGLLDDAFEVADGFLLSRGPVVRFGPQLKPENEDMNDAVWRINTQWLFTPPPAVMRADPRFLPLCDGMGLVEYWRRRGVRPDYQLSG